MRVYFSLDDLKYGRMGGPGGRGTGADGVSSAYQADARGERRQARAGWTGAQSDTGAPGAGRHAVWQLGDQPAHVAVIHAHAPEAAEQVRVMFARARSALQIIVSELSVGIAVHLVLVRWGW